MHLYLIRHAQSGNNELYYRTGAAIGRHPDPPITDLGHRQAQHLAHILAATRDIPSDEERPYMDKFIDRFDRRGFGLTHLYCSLMVRSVQTGSYIAGATGLPLMAWPEFHERGGLRHRDEETGENIGVAGPGRGWFATEYPHLIVPDTLGETGWWGRSPETLDESWPRARQVWSELLARHGETDDRVAVVSHIGFFQTLMMALFTAGDSNAAEHMGLTGIGFGMSNTSITRLEITNGQATLRYLNRVDFFPDGLITG